MFRCVAAVLTHTPLCSRSLLPRPAKDSFLPLVKVSLVEEVHTAARLEKLFLAIAHAGSIEHRDFDAVFGTSDETVFARFDTDADGCMSQQDWLSYIEALQSEKGPAVLDEALPYWERRAKQSGEETKRRSSPQGLPQVEFGPLEISTRIQDMRHHDVQVELLWEEGFKAEQVGCSGFPLFVKDLHDHGRE